MAKSTRRNAARVQSGPTFDVVFEAARSEAFKRTGKGSNAGKPVISLQLREPVPAAEGAKTRTKWSLYRWLSKVYSHFNQTADIMDMRTRLESAGHSIGGDVHNGFAVYQIGHQAKTAGVNIEAKMSDDFSKLLSGV